MDYSNDNIVEWNYTEDDIAEKYHFFNELKDGRIHILDPRGPGSMKIPPADDPETGVKIRDVMITDKVAARLYLPPSVEADTAGQKLPLLFYAHGGAFCMYSPFSVDYTRLVTKYVAEFNVVAVAPTYGLFPDRPGAYYEDSWVALKWVAEHADPGSDVFKLGTSDPWISNYADLNRIFIGGDSGGANITHAMMRNIRKEGLPGNNAKVEGIIMVHPYFGDNCKQWLRMNPINEGPQDPRMKPATEDLANLKCDRVLVFLAEIDPLRPAGDNYVEAIKKSGWKGGLEVVDNKGRMHNFHITNYTDEETIIIDERIKAFINKGKGEN
ncbi:putative carboxylesterase 12 [Silene latifolia]